MGAPHFLFEYLPNALGKYSPCMHALSDRNVSHKALFLYFKVPTNVGPLDVGPTRGHY